ncbi:hypothetical protein GCM10020255_008260 [Rhodococcus baikonurensis]
MFDMVSPRVVPIQVAMEWMLTGRVFPAAEAHENGLVRSVHAPDNLLAAAYELARKSWNPPLPYRRH